MATAFCLSSKSSPSVIPHTLIISSKSFSPLSPENGNKPLKVNAVAPAVTSLSLLRHQAVPSPWILPAAIGVQQR